MPKANCTSTHAVIRTVQTGSRATLVAICAVLAVAGAIAFLPAAATGRPVSLGPKIRIDINKLLGRSLPRDAHCSAFVSILSKVAVRAPCGSLGVGIDNRGGRLNGCYYGSPFPSVPPYWDCRAETAHIKIQSAASQKSVAEKRLQEAIDLVLRVSRTGR